MIKEAILLINLGTPDDPSPGKVRKYLSQFLNDRRVIDIHPIGRFLLVNLIIIPLRSFKSSKLYKAVWSDKGSPLLINSENLKNKLKVVVGNHVHVELAMRYQEPSIDQALESIRKVHPDKIYILPLYPQYASSSTGSTIEEFMRIIKKWEVIPNIEIISKFYDHPQFIKALIQVASHYDHSQYDHVLFSYHGLPERHILKGSGHYGENSCKMGSCCDSLTDKNRYCYRANCMETTRQLVNALNIPEGKYTSCFQSRLDNKWLKPYSDKVIEDLAKAGKKSILVFSPAFVADCLETVYEIGTEYQEIFSAHGGGKVTLVKSLNSEDVWVNAVKEIVLG